MAGFGKKGGKANPFAKKTDGADKKFPWEKAGAKANPFAKKGSAKPFAKGGKSSTK